MSTYKTTATHCTCKGWMYQKVPPSARVCKHMTRTKVASTMNLTTPPKLMLFSHNNKHTNRSWLWSEKYDGVRAKWDGKNLITRGGLILDIPFDLPLNHELDGELFAGYNTRQSVIECMYADSKSSCWDHVVFKVFDIPSIQRPFEARYDELKKLAKTLPDISVVKQSQLDEHETFGSILSTVVNKGGEGLIIRDPLHYPYTGRNIKKGVKYKPAICGEGIVKGKNSIQEDGNESVFYAVTPDEANIGDNVVFTFSGRTKTGKPEYPGRVMII